MHQMRGRFGLTIVGVAVAIAAGACTSEGVTGDKAGGAGEPMVLRMANSYGGLDQLPAVSHFVDRVEELSSGEVRIEVMDAWGDFAPGVEQQLVQSVSAGEVDLGWVGTRVFDTLGVKSFQALTAPMLIDSYALQNAVIRSGITEEMLPALDEVGVVGLGVLADGLRKPIGVDGPIVGPTDWQDISFGSFGSEGQERAIEALGATPAEVIGPYREEAIADAAIQGFEFSLFIYQDPQWVGLAPYVTANVNLWPQMDVLIADPARLEALTDEQQGWLQRAAEDAARRSAALADSEERSIDIVCQSGARFAEASESEIAALEAAFAPVYTALEQDPETKTFIERIQELKASTPAAPSLSIPSDCTGEAPEQASDATGGTGSAPAFLNGTYRWVLTQADADEVGDPETNYPHIATITLEDGHLEGGCFGAGGGTYSIEGDRITFYSVEYDGYTTVTFSVDGEGNLHLTPVLPMDPGTAFECYYKPWRKIG
jgi:TRAP-type C4-dicarboxylate transport system substrate-binding protein